ncbi:hypothetical protein ERD78_18645 [Allopusillimonas soli]|uniref:Uncharacterized protein n=1 Tax=Allopusillimonas soli TaxID=659016 RepID=A0A853FDG6_9BURK|nr:hypothetical protein [Allopusillimonas soli]NYT38914.1 hypothetical protein [Allopusillimonas soli]TEA70088.1 hypothetical protein ERD78_18645 [Allopusillimonas soli]
MRALFIATAIVAASAAQAQTATSKTESVANAAAQNAGNAQNITFQSSGSGTQTIKSAPQMGSLGLFGSFSSDNCMVSAGGGVSIIGVGVQGATPVRDEQCAILRGFERTMQAASTVYAVNPALSAKLQQAAIDTLCSLNETVGAALRHQGVCSYIAAPEQLAQSMSATTFTARIEP